MKFLLIMRGRSYLREAITFYLRTELAATDIVSVSEIAEIDDMHKQTLDAIDLVLVHIDHESVESPGTSQTMTRLRSRLPSTPIVLLGDLADENQSRLALKKGAAGYIPTGTPAEIFKHALPIIASGGIYASPYVYASVDEYAPTEIEDPLDIGSPAQDDDIPEFDQTRSHEPFTSREAEVLALLGRGLPNKLIAYRLDLKEGTVKVHVRHIMKKLKVTSRTQAALFAQKNLSSIIR